MFSPVAIETWFYAFEAQEILRTLNIADFRRARADGVAGAIQDRMVWRPTTDAAIEACGKLDAIVTDAIDARAGYTFASTQHPFDEVACTRWLNIRQEMGDVSAALESHFAEQVAA